MPPRPSAEPKKLTANEYLRRMRRHLDEFEQLIRDWRNRWSEQQWNLVFTTFRERHVLEIFQAHEKNPLAVELGRRGGSVGGVARAKNLSPKRRSEIAKQAANARWSKRRGRT